MASRWTCADVLRETDFCKHYARESFTKRQRAALNRFLDGLEGLPTARKWAAIGKCSISMAHRGINEPIEVGVLRRNPGGSKNTSYCLVTVA